jgi:hypothetical protein
MVYLPPELMEKLREAAKKDYRSVSAQLRYILERFFAGRDGPTFEGWLKPKLAEREDADDEHAPEDDEDAAA